MNYLILIGMAGLFAYNGKISWILFSAILFLFIALWQITMRGAYSEVASGTAFIISVILFIINFTV